MPGPGGPKSGCPLGVVIVTAVLAALTAAILFSAFLPAWGAAAELANCTAVCVDTHLEN